MDVHRVVDPFFDVNLFLVVSRGDALLVDTGTGARTEEILQQLRAHLGDAALTSLVLTHRHADHVGGANQIARAFDLVPRISADDAPPLRRGDTRATGASLFGLPQEPTEAETLRYDATLRVGEASFEVLHTPGHTVGGISLLGEDGSLFTGDTAFAYGGVGRWDLETGSFPDLLASLKALEARGAEDLYPGHGPAVRKEAAQHLHLAVEMAEAMGP